MMSDTIAALATARGAAALAIVRLTGPEAIAIADRLFRPAGRILELPTHTCAVGYIVDGDERVDQVVVSVFRGPNSFTGEDLTEITTHGGHLSPTRILDLVFATGRARPAREGEFTQRAFLNGKLDLAQAEAVERLITARSVAAGRAAMRILSGELQRVLSATMDRVTEALACIEAGLDIQEDGAPDALSPLARTSHQRSSDSELSCAKNAEPSGAAEMSVDRVRHVLREEKSRLQRLLQGGRAGRLMEEGLRVAITGRSNAGKSSLFNAFLARDRAIVSAEPGTTRDFLEGWVDWDGLPVVLVDTAGLTETRTPLEQEGARRTLKTIEAAAIVVQVVDVAETEPEEAALDAVRLKIPPERLIAALHKWDLVACHGWDSLSREGSASDESPFAHSLGVPVPLVPSSVAGDPGIDRLGREIRAKLRDALGDTEATLIVGERQRRLLEGALEAMGRAEQVPVSGAGAELTAFELRGALDLLGELLGVSVGPRVLDEIFARFCVGK